MEKYDVIIIGGGPAGLAAAISAHDKGAKVLIVEREASLGGILKQCIHDGFGLVRFGEKLSGPEYAERFIDEVKAKKIDYLLLAFVTKIERENSKFILSIVTREGIKTFEANALVLATGCRERTAKQVFIQGTRPSGIFTAGTAQHFVNLLGVMPCKKCVILGSGDIGLIMARRLTLEGAQVVGVYEAKDTPSGLTRNIMQCLTDFNIPLHLSTTVTKVFGHARLEAVEISKVDSNMNPIDGTQEIIECDGLILSVGLIPENELAESVGVKSDGRAKGAVCDNTFMTNVDGVFTAGNATHVNDLVDYVSESGEIAGANAAAYAPKTRELVQISADKNTLYIVPESLDCNSDLGAVVMFFRSATVMKDRFAVVRADGKEIFKKRYQNLKPPEMERICIDFSKCGLTINSSVEFSIEEG